MANKNKIAVLIDGDNAESFLIEQILAEAGRYGKVTVKRIYADWTNIRMKGWKEQINTHAIRPIQKFSYTSGKNSTDSALIIDAMDLLYSKHVDGFCIVSSDSDYTGIAHRIREEGLFVMGIGRSHTPEAFVKACENFTYAEILMPPESKEDREPKKEIRRENPKGSNSKGPNSRTQNTRMPNARAPKPETLNLEVLKPEAANPEPPNPEVPKAEAPKSSRKIDLNLIGSLKKSGIKPIDLDQIDTAFRMAVSEDTGQALLSDFGVALRRIDSTFDPRNFGFYSFRKFCESLSPNFEVIKHEDGTTLSLKKKD